MARTFRLLRPDEIEVRVSEVLKDGKGVRLLLYKTARTDSAILDETFGPMRWQCRYESIDGKMYCGIGVKDAESGEWIWKCNVGTESNTEAEKGQASDALKRAGFTWGIGAELYTAPQITVWKDAADIKESGGKWRCYDTFTVERIEYDGAGRIIDLVISNTKKDCIAYSMLKKKAAPRPEPVYCDACGQEITGYVGKNKKPVPIAEGVAWSREAFGKTLCAECIRLARKEATA